MDAATTRTLTLGHSRAQVLWLGFGAMLMCSLAWWVYDLRQGYLLSLLRTESIIAANRDSNEFDLAVEATELIDNIADAAAIASIVGALPTLAKKGALRGSTWIAKKLGYKNPRTYAVKAAITAAPRVVQRSFFSAYRRYMFPASYLSHSAGKMYRSRIDIMSRKVVQAWGSKVDPRGLRFKPGYELDHIMPVKCCWQLGWSRLECSNPSNLRYIPGPLNRGALAKLRERTCLPPRDKDLLAGTADLEKLINAKAHWLFGRLASN